MRKISYEKYYISNFIIRGFRILSCSSATNETVSLNGGKTDNAKVGASNNGVNKTETNKSIEVSKNSNTSSEANKTSELTKCELTKAPVIKGFSLSQTVDEINAKQPFFKKAYEAEKEKELEDRKKAKFVLMTLGSSFKDEEIRYVEDFKEVNLIWHFLDDKLMALVVNYRDDETLKIGKVKPLIDKIAKEYNLPKDDWEFDKEEGAILNCQGFRADVSKGSQSGPSLMITDVTAEKEGKKRGL